jgi:hypothetical protein
VHHAFLVRVVEAVRDLSGVDPDVEVVRVYQRGNDAFDRAVELSREAGDTLTTSLLPGLEMPLVRIFRE